MPLPTPASAEGHDEFIERCMGDDVMAEDFPQTEQRLAVCETRWRDKGMKPETKLFTLSDVKIDNDGEGTFEAVFATLDKIDSDGDSYDPGAIGMQDVVISGWNHAAWETGEAGLPVGIGTTSERGNQAIINGSFDMGDPVAVRHYKKLKYLKENGRNIEWSFALPKTEWRVGERDGQEGVRIFTNIQVPEVSPVMLGAGVGTELLAIKQREATVSDEKNNPEPMKFATQLDSAVEAVEAVVDRAKDIRALREEKGKDGMSKSATRRLQVLSESLEEAKSEIEGLLEDERVIQEELDAIAQSLEDEYAVASTG